MSRTMLNIADFEADTRSLGPGRRFALWVQGCPFNCPNCIAPDWIPFRVAKVMSIKAMADVIVHSEWLDGISISGGEPMMQAGRLAKLLDLVKSERPHLDVIVFTGFKKKQLVWEEAQTLLARIDVLIDGLYVDHLNDNKGLRGSNNQAVHFLTDKLRDQQDYFTEKPRTLEFHVKDDGVLMVGVPGQNFKW